MEPSVTVNNTLIILLVLSILIGIASNAYWWHKVKSLKGDWQAKFDLNLAEKIDHENHVLMEIRKSEISQREFDVLMLVADNDIEKIAEKLFISTHTVNQHLKNIRRKLRIANVREMVPYSEAAKLMRGI